MNYIELSLEKLRTVSIEAAKKIQLNHHIDLILYVARAGLPIAVYMNEILKCQILGISAVRKGNYVKSMLGKFMSYFPVFIRNGLIAIELKSKVHKENSNRNVVFHDSLKNIDTEKIKTILIVDDSVDTGHSLNCVLEKVKVFFPDAIIKTYSLNVWEQSKELVIVDYYTYKNTIIKSPMSKDSKEYQKFCLMYDKTTDNGYI